MPNNPLLHASTRPGTKIILPDLVSHCDFKVEKNKFHQRASAESKEWLFQGDSLPPKKRDAYHGLKAGLLTAMCYPNCGYDELRVCCDYLNYLFHLDNLSDDMRSRDTRLTADVVLNSLYHPVTFESSARLSRMTKDYWTRLTPTASEGSQQRFIETFDLFFQAVHQQAKDREASGVPDLERYIDLRRDTSGCKPCWALIEYANGLHIPDGVIDHPIIRNLGEAANDLVTWSNDIFSYNVEQSKGDTHNMIVVVMNQFGLALQPAVDFVGDMCKRSIDRFKEDKTQLPSWGPEIDRDVQVYVDGLEHWISGSLHWSFETERYFGKNGRDVKASRIVTLLPPRNIPQTIPLKPSTSSTVHKQPTSRKPQFPIPRANSISLPSTSQSTAADGNDSLLVANHSRNDADVRGRPKLKHIVRFFTRMTAIRRRTNESRLIDVGTSIPPAYLAILLYPVVWVFISLLSWWTS